MGWGSRHIKAKKKNYSLSFHNVPISKIMMLNNINRNIYFI
ncbi:hypothetical protein SPAB_04225 [Salmonella enterica subsp. enterica serovar Paratyphi B str. SPB7]|uniref:Uncharacterized protein n=1 Tax=Salmonella paratyphi B (strain ATCC BAA-1250 / SPB7) TaxID=1016998 RepID=A0A6C6Z6L9_SALPB|nr:hypothetical protein SPAB_04225 [Salmonella enterica subsp. enterica serovar Paratyphi B str. SPB7]